MAAALSRHQSTSSTGWAWSSSTAVCHACMPSVFRNPGRNFLTKVNANFGNSAVSSSIEEVGLATLAPAIFLVNITESREPIHLPPPQRVMAVLSGLLMTCTGGGEAAVVGSVGRGHGDGPVHRPQHQGDARMGAAQQVYEQNKCDRGMARQTFNLLHALLVVVPTAFF